MIKYLPQVQVSRDTSSLRWQGVSKSGSTSFWRIDAQKVTSWQEAIERINSYPDFPCRVIVILHTGYYWLFCEICDSSKAIAEFYPDSMAVPS